MNTPDDVLVKMEDGAVARVYCTRCNQEIGELDAVPDDETGEEAVTRREEFEGELSVIAQEHRVLCSNAPEDEIIE